MKRLFTSTIIFSLLIGFCVGYLSRSTSNPFVATFKANQAAFDSAYESYSRDPSLPNVQLILSDLEPAKIHQIKANDRVVIFRIRGFLPDEDRAYVRFPYDFDQSMTAQFLAKDHLVHFKRIEGPWAFVEWSD